MEVLTHAGGPRFLLLQAPAGYGKTTLLLALRRELVLAGTDVAWVALGADDDDPLRFFEALLAGLAEVDPALVHEAAVLAERGSGAEATETLAIAVVRAIAARQRPLMLVLDDVHHLHDARIVAALQLLLDYAPPVLRCALAARSPVPLALGRWRAQGKLLELGLDELRFTPAEAEQLAISVLGEVDARQLRELQECSDGWAAGLKLLCLGMRRPRAGHAQPAERVSDEQAFARYFDREVLARLKPTLIDRLARCAIPEHFDLALCTALGGVPDEGETTLDHMSSRGLFLLPAGPRYPQGWWRLHPLLRDVLLRRLDIWPTHEREALHAIAWRFFAAHGMVYDAVRHALLAGAPEAAADLVQESAQGLFTRGELRQVVSLVRLLPPDTVRARSGLRLWLAYAQLYDLRLDECAQSIARLQSELANASSAERYRLTLLRVLYAVQRDDSAQAMTILPELLAAPPDADAIALTGRRNLLTWIYLYRGEYEHARQVQMDDPPRLADGQPLHGSAFGVLPGRCLLGLTHVVEGQVIQAERIYRDVLYEAEKRGHACADAGTLAVALLGEVLYELNDWRGALALLESRLDVLEQVSIPDTSIRVSVILSRCRWMAGRPLDALEGLEQMEDRAELMGLDRMGAYALLVQLEFCLRRRELAAARAAMKKLEALDARHTGVETGALSEIQIAAERGRIRTAMETGDLSWALQHLKALIALCSQRGRARRVPHLLLQSAAANGQLGHHDAARADTREALRLGHRLSLVRTMLDAHEDALKLIEEVGRDPALDPVLAFYAERLIAAAREGAPGASANTAPATPQLEVLSPRESEIVQLLMAAHSNKKIARALDLSLDTVKWHLKNIYVKLGVSGRDQILERFRT